MSALVIGAATVDPSTRSITADGHSKRISVKAMAVLTALVEADGDVVSRDALLTRVWPDVFVGEEVLTQAIAELRRAFGDTPRRAQYIETVPKGGYRLAQSADAQDNTLKALLPPHFDDGAASVEAISAYMSVCETFDRGGRENIDAAITLCRDALDHDPTFAPAHAWLSIALTYKHLYYSHAAKLMPEALNAARAAISHDRINPEGYAAQGLALAHLGDLDHAVTSFNAAIRLQLDSFYPLNLFGVVLYSHGAYGPAGRVFDRAASIRADAAQAMMMSAKAWRAAGDETAASLRIKKAALRCDRRLAEDPDDRRALICKTYCQISSGGADSAETLLSRLEDCHDPVTFYIVAGLAHAGEKTAAVDRFEAIVDNGWADSRFLKFDSDMNALRGEPRFRKIATALAA